MTVGATDPPSLAAALRSGARCVLPRVSLLGQLRRVPPGDAAYARRRAAAAHAAAAPDAPAAKLDHLHPFKMDTECDRCDALCVVAPLLCA